MSHDIPRIKIEMIKINFYTKLNNTIVNCKKVPSLLEILSQNIEDFKSRLQEHSLPMQIIVDEKLLNTINLEVARSASSKYHSKSYKIYFDPNKNYVIEIKSL
jgi:predicted transcriptional regulator